MAKWVSRIINQLPYARSTMVESKLGGQFWLSAAVAAKDACNVTYKQCIRKTPWEMMYGTKKE
jgi:hypothetical protein